MRNYMSEDITITLPHVFIHPHLDYCNSLLYNLPKYMTKKLQKFTTLQHSGLFKINA